MDELSEKDISSLKLLKEKIEGSDSKLIQNALENGEFQDAFILQFLRSRKYDIQSSFDRIKSLHQNRVEKFPKIIANMLPSYPPIRFGIVEGGIKLLKHRDPNGSCVITLRSKAWNNLEINGDDICLLVTLFGCECLNQFHDSAEKGFVVIIDVAGFSFSHARSFTPNVLMRWASIIISASPVKVKALRFVNVHPIFKATLAVLKLVLTKKVAARVHVYGKPENGFLDEFMPSAHLPESLGGDLSDDEATDLQFKEQLLSPEREEYYREFAKPSLAALNK